MNCNQPYEQPFKTTTETIIINTEQALRANVTDFEMSFSVYVKIAFHKPIPQAIFFYLLRRIPNTKQNDAISNRYGAG